jgi:hypothetical protein
MIIFCTCCRHLEPLSLSLVNTKNQPNEKKKIIFLEALSEWIL